MKRIRSVFWVLCLMLLTSGCSAAETQADTKEPVTIRFAWWGDAERNERTEEAVSLFMEKNPDIVVQTACFPYDAYYENMDICMETGYMPDVWQGFVGGNNDYLHAGLVEPLDDYVERGLIHVEDISDSLLETGRIEGKLYGISLGCNVKCMVIMTKYFQRAGLKIPQRRYESWEDLEEALLDIREISDIAIGGNIFNRDFTFDYFCLQRGEQKFLEGGKPVIGFSRKTYVDYYEMWMRWEKEGLVPSYTDIYLSRLNPDSEQDDMNCVLNILYSNQFEQAVEKTGERMQLLLMPGTEEIEIRPGSHVCMSSVSEQKDAAARLINFLINDVEANQIYNGERGMPASDKVRKELLPGFNEEQQQMAELIEFAEEHSRTEYVIVTSEQSEVDDGINGGLMEELEQQIMLKQLEPQEAYEILAERFGEK